MHGDSPVNDRNKRRAAAATIAVAIAAPAEGIRRIAYYDPPGILTVCRGHTGADVIKGKVYSLAECDKFMTDDMRKAIAIVDRCHPNLPVNVLAAFGDAVFNGGSTIACDTKKSQAARHLYKGDLVAGCNELPRWNKTHIAGVAVTLPGLTTRREEERVICLQGL
jgi:lysozyme